MNDITGYMLPYHEPEAYIRSINYPNTVTPDEAFHVIIKVCNKYYDSGCPADLYCKVTWTDRNQVLVDKRETVECYSCLSTVDIYFTAISEDMHLNIEVGHKSFQPPYNWVVDETRDITIVVVECEDEETKCIGTDLYKCVDGKWVLYKRGAPECMGDISIEGVVRDKIFRFPLGNTKIVIDEQTVYTDIDGFYHVESLPADTDISIQASKFLYLPVKLIRRYNTSGTYTVDIELIPLWFILLILGGGIGSYLYYEKTKEKEKYK